MASFPQTWIDNPVAEAELTHQQRSGSPSRWRRWPALFALGLSIALISNLCLLLVPQIAALLQVSAFDLRDLLVGWFGTITILMGALIMIHHLSFSTAALQLASTSIAREKQGRTWESLLLTGVDARRIILGKWSATLRTLWQVYRPLLLLRFAVALWMGLSSGITHGAAVSFSPPLISILLIASVTAAFPLCYAAFMGTLGLLASLLVKSETAAYRIGVLFQCASVVISMSLILLSFALPFGEIEPGLVAFIPALFVTPLDGGMLALIGLIANTDSASHFYLVGLLLCVSLYAALTGFALRAAQSLAIRQRALPPL
ncbi:MAG: hypothetical protein GC204_12460 [Chloroflexi bacterium]|nr:hypothetical protein [Chloroflexota bacterium]